MKTLIKNLLAIIAIAFFTTTFTSCQSGYGCPGHITQKEKIRPPANVDVDCSIVVLDDTNKGS